MEIEAETLPPVVWDEDPEIDHFDQSKLALKWNFIRNSRDVDWSLEERKGWLALRGTEVKLIDSGTPAFIGCRQRHFLCDISTRLDFSPQEGDEAGLVVYMNETHHYAIGLTKIERNDVITLRGQVGSMTIDRHSPPIKGSIVDLRVQATPEKYMFSYKCTDQLWHILGEAETHFVSTEVAGGFTGVFFGIYNHSVTKTTAYFDWFQYRKE